MLVSSNKKVSLKNFSIQITFVWSGSKWKLGCVFHQKILKNTISQYNWIPVKIYPKDLKKNKTVQKVLLPFIN